MGVMSRFAELLERPARKGARSELFGRLIEQGVSRISIPGSLVDVVEGAKSGNQNFAVDVSATQEPDYERVGRLINPNYEKWKRGVLNRIQTRNSNANERYLPRIGHTPVRYIDAFAGIRII